ASPSWHSPRASSPPTEPPPSTRSRPSTKNDPAPGLAPYRAAFFEDSTFHPPRTVVELQYVFVHCELFRQDRTFRHAAEVDTLLETFSETRHHPEYPGFDSAHSTVYVSEAFGVVWANTKTAIARTFMATMISPILQAAKGGLMTSSFSNRAKRSAGML